MLFIEIIIDICFQLRFCWGQADVKYRDPPYEFDFFFMVMLFNTSWLVHNKHDIRWKFTVWNKSQWNFKCEIQQTLKIEWR